MRTTTTFGRRQGRSATRGRPLPWALSLCAVLVLVLAPASVGARERSELERQRVVARAGSGAAPTALQQRLLAAVRQVGFDRVLDFGNGGRRIAHTPNVDVAVIELDREGRAVDAANVLLSRDYPDGQVVPLTGDLGTTSVRWTAWDARRWSGSRPWRSTSPADDLVSGRSNAPLTFMAPYPASLFKVMVAWRVLRLVDAGRLRLSSVDSFTPSPRTGNCTGGRTTIRGWLDRMITVSDNNATCALVKRLHELGEVSRMNREFRQLGLGTLQVLGTRAGNGGGWFDGLLNMTALDTARLMWLVDGGAGTLWRKPGGGAVTAGLLKPSSRALFRKLLEEDGWNNTLSTVNWCGRQRFGRVYPAFGIPQRAPSRWISRRTGSVVVHGDDFGQAVEPCQRAAEVRFAHKIGLVSDHASDAGIVRSLPGAPFRRYVVAVLGNLGQRYGDPEFTGLGRSPCFVPSIGICRTERFAQLGKLIDTAIARPRLAYDPLIARAGARQPTLRPTRIDPGSSLRDVSITPALPAGLTLNPATGSIGGTPRERTALRRHTVTASDAQGAVSARLWIVVRGASAAAGRVSVTERGLAW